MIPDHGDAFATLVIVAAGRSERFGNRAKILEVVAGSPVLVWSLHAADGASTIGDVVIVTGSHTETAIIDTVNARRWSKPVAYVMGSSTRQSSVAAGVRAVPASSEVVLVHDGARPLVSAALFDRCSWAARNHGAAIVAVPVSDTLKRVSKCNVVETVSREALWAAQTPQGFQRNLIVAALDRVRTLDREFTDEASLLEALGETVWIVPGERTNIKITHQEDLEIADALLRSRSVLGAGS